jgi:hypothetical protein
MARSAAVLLAALLAAGCSGRPVAVTPPPRHYLLAPGDHRIAIDVPRDWTVVSQGNEIRIRKGTIEKGVLTIEIHDLGPAGLEGVRDEIQRARDLWIAGKDGDARWRLRRVMVSREWFPTATQRSNFWSELNDLTDAGPHTDFSEVEGNFIALLDSVRALEPLPFDAAVDQALGSVEDLKSRRQIGSRRSVTIDGHDSQVIETWYRLAHSDPRRYVVIRNRSRLLAIWMDASRSGAPYPSFDEIVRSLRIENTSQQASLGS